MTINSDLQCHDVMPRPHVFHSGTMICTSEVSFFPYLSKKVSKSNGNEIKDVIRDRYRNTIRPFIFHVKMIK